VEDIKFTNPPIAEAIFDVRVKLADDFAFDSLEKFQLGIEEEFPRKQLRNDISANLEISEIEQLPSAVPLVASKSGYFFTSEDGKRIAQVRVDGFTYSQLKPYATWEVFSKNAYELWGRYKSIIRPTEVTRLALRYINRIEIPTNSPIEMKEYLTTGPEISDSLQASILEQFMRVVITIPSYHPSLAIVSMKVDSNDQPADGIAIIFDIDVFQEVSLSPSDDTILTTLFEENLKRFRKEIFMKSITPKTMELFQ
jgi:uncharacterized protein (TIGR04255 family)